MSRFKHGALTVCLCLIALANTGCAQGDGLTESDRTSLVIHVPNADERVLGPDFVRPWSLVFLGLSVDPEGTEDHQPRLLDRWEHTPDYTEWTLYLRDDVRWDDGVPVTAADVKFSLEFWSHPEVMYEYPFFEKIMTLDSHSLQITFKKPVAGTIFTYSWLAMLPKHSLDTLKVEQIFDWPFWIQPIGNGPYRYSRHIPGIMTELTANPDYYGERPNISTVVLRFGGNPLTELLSGNVDVASDITPLESVQLTADPRFQIYHRIQYSQDVAIAWNHHNPLFSDAAVRRALTMSIDRRELHRLLNYPDDIPIFDVPAKTRHFVHGLVPDPLPFDPERAAQELVSEGWVDTDDDGIREKNGQEFRFTLSISPETAAQAVYVQDQLHRAGIGMEISTHDRSVLWKITRERDFDATILTYNYIERFGEFRASGYDNPDARRLRDAAWFTIDQGEVDRHLGELWQIFATEIPVTYLHPRLSYVAANRRVGGMQNGRDIYSMIEHLWIEDEEGTDDPS
jgi:peptide/nickel transport system substrate-binding protein